MAFRLSTEGAAIFKLSGQSTDVTDLLDAKLLFDPNFIGGKCNRFVQAVTRTLGTMYSGTVGMADTDTRKRFSTSFTIYYGKTYDKPPPVFACYENNYAMPYNPTFNPQTVVSEWYFYDHHFNSGTYVDTEWGWRGVFYTDRAYITTYEFDGNFVLYVVDA